MKRTLLLELQKAFSNIYFYFAIALGMILVSISAADRISAFYAEGGFLSVAERLLDIQNEMGYLKSPLVPASNLYNNWIGGEYQSIGSVMFFALFPFLACLPYGHAFCSERNSGYSKVLLPKCGRKRYFSAKLLAAFLSGGTAVLIPLVSSLMICATVFPAATPSVVYDQYYSIAHGDMLASLAYNAPLAYIIIYLFIDFVFAGIFACLSISITFFIRKAVSSIAVPFLAVHICALLRDFLRYISYVEISPIFLMHAMPIANYTKPYMILAWLIAFVLLTVPIVLVKGEKYEVL